MNRKNRLVLKWTAIALCCVVIAFCIPLITSGFEAEKAKPVVIVLDPGHGGSDMGACNAEDGLYESELNLAIALACRDELSRYANVEVYMTHEGLGYSRKLSLTDRINLAGEVGADMLVSLHCNDADNHDAAGSEIYVSHSTYKEEYYQKSSELALEILREFRALGMKIRGVKTRYSNGSRMYYHEDGSEEVGDYYAVIGGTIKRYGIPGILVEHGFVYGDAAYLSKPENLRALGVADATAIAKYYGLHLFTDADLEPDEDAEPVSEAVIVTDNDIISASDVNSALMQITDDPSAEDYDSLQQLRQRYEKLSAPAKTLVKQEDIDRLYHAILSIDIRLYPVRIVPTESSELSSDRIGHTIIGVPAETDSVAGMNAAELSGRLSIYADPAYATAEQQDISGVQLVITDPDDRIVDIGATVGTGVAASIWKNGVMLDRLTVVITGDISGDGRVDSLDELLLKEYLYNGAELSPAALAAADADQSGSVNEDDLTALTKLIFRYEE